MPHAHARPWLPSRPCRGIGLPQSRQAPDDRIHARALLCFVASAAMAAAAPAYAQTAKPVEANTPDRCSGVMERINEARVIAPGHYTKTQMNADDRCLGVLERVDKARMITRDAYVKAFKHQPDCAVPAYGYLCE